MFDGRKCGFTIVEMLTVVGIISILAAITLPIMSAAKESARGSVCLSNLNSLGHAVSLYSSDYDGRYPFGLSPFEIDQLYLYYDEPYLTLGREMGDLRSVLGPYVKDNDIYYCPSDRNLPGEAQNASFFDRYGSSYSYEAHPAMLGINDTYFPQPASNYLMADIEFWHGGSNSADGRMNELFADYHVRNVSYRELQGSAVLLP